MLSDFAPHVWEMYQHLYESRQKLEDKLNYFLAIDTLFIIGYLELCGNEVKNLSVIHIVPLVLLSIPVLLLFINFSSPTLRSPWFEKESLISELERGTVYIDWLAAVYDCAYMSFDYMQRRVALLRICLVLAWLAIAFMFLVFCLKLSSQISKDLPASLIVILVVTVIGVVGYAIRRVLSRYTYRSREEEVRGLFTEWLSKGESK